MERREFLAGTLAALALSAVDVKAKSPDTFDSIAAEFGFTKISMVHQVIVFGGTKIVDHYISDWGVYFHVSQPTGTVCLSHKRGIIFLDQPQQLRESLVKLKRDSEYY